MLIYKNNSDRKGNSYGSHENYLMDRRTSFKQIVENLMPFFVTRQVYCGAGKVGAENRSAPVDYQISQRADFFETEVALDTMVKRPIINTRDEPHADREKYRRLHVIVGDANLSEYTIYLRNGVTAIVLSMIEDGAIDSRPGPARPRARRSRRSPTTRPAAAELTLDDGRRLTAVEVQAWSTSTWPSSLLQLPKSDRPDRQKDVLAKWEHALEKPGARPHGARRRRSTGS